MVCNVSMGVAELWLIPEEADGLHSWSYLFSFNHHISHGTPDREGEMSYISSEQEMTQRQGIHCVTLDCGF